MEIPTAISPRNWDKIDVKPVGPRGPKSEIPMPTSQGNYDRQETYKTSRMKQPHNEPEGLKGIERGKPPAMSRGNPGTKPPYFPGGKPRLIAGGILSG